LVSANLPKLILAAVFRSAALQTTSKHLT